MSNNSGNEKIFDIVSQGYNQNFKIIPGSSMVISSGIEVNYFYSYIDFSQVQIQNFTSDPTKNISEFIQTMDGKKHLIWIPLLSSVTSGGLFNASGDGQILNHGDILKYHDLPIGMRTAAGSIINQPFVPSQNFGPNSSDVSSSYTTSIKNGIVYSSDPDKSQTYSSQAKSYEWNVAGLNVVKQYQSQQLDEIITGDGSLRRVFGYRQPYNYITNKQCKQKYVDVDNVIADRYYNCSMPDDGGSFAFCYEYGPYTPVNVKRGERDIDAAPFLLLTISSVVYNDTKEISSSQQSSVGFESGQVACYITMPPDGQITARVGTKYQAQGGLSVPSNDLLPPQCKKEGNQFTTKPLFIYPIYSGLVVTNSLIKSSQSKGEQIFVSFPSKTDPRFETKIHNADMSPQQSSLASTLQSKSQLKLFPSLFQQKKGHDLKLSVNSDFRINFTNQLQLACIRSLCNFACCPLFFSRTLKFTLYFKGANKQQDSVSNDSDTSDVSQNTSFSYYFFPIVYNANISKVSFEKGCTISQNQTLIQPIDNCTSVAYDDDKKETIYKVDFLFQSNKAFRYPLQVFGAICVLKRYGNQFKVFNSNGSFTLPFSSSYVSSVSSYWDLITNCDLQYGLDGVTGSLNLDSYPIVGEIDNILPKQSIGEIDLDIQFIDNNSSSTESGSPFSLFKGFGMQVSKQNAENSYTLGVNLIGTQKKMQDMKLICAPFWDGDRLQAICSYFQSFLKLNLKMIDHNVKQFGEARSVDNNIYSASGTWSACTSDNLIKQGGSQQFRVGRSWNWQSPHINFTTGTSCLQALNKLADDTSCVFVVGYDGTGYFYELNPFGYPYYVDNQINIVEFPLASVINFNIRPQLQSKYNAVATFGFLVQKGANKDQQDSLKVSTAPGSFYTQIGVDSDGNPITTSDSSSSVNFPWQRTTLSVQQGYLTKLQLLRAHSNRIKRSKADFFTGSVTVLGNPYVNHIYQRIKIGEQQFFVNSINHSINLQSKTWQTTYGIQWTSLMDKKDESSKN